MCTSRSTRVVSDEIRSPDALHALGRLLRDHGYWDACRLHRNRYIDRRYFVYLKQNRRSFPRQTRALIELFVCRSSVPAAALDFVPPPVLESLIDEGVLARQADGTIRSTFTLHVLENLLLLTEEYRDPVRSVYFGEDSEFYASMLEIAPGSSCLDLCTGTGVQALISLSRGARRVDAVDVHPRAVRVGRLNARLNDFTDRVQFHEGDLFDPLPPGRTYDRITCNPPLLPIPDGVPYPPIGHGGPDGLRFTRKILAALDERLAPGGKCLLLGLSTADDESEIERLCRKVCREPLGHALYLLVRQSIDRYADLVVSTVGSLYPDENPLRLSRVLRRAYRETGATSVVSYYLSVRRDGAGVPSGVYDLTRNNHSQNYWFVGTGP